MSASVHALPAGTTRSPSPAKGRRAARTRRPATSTKLARKAIRGGIAMGVICAAGMAVSLSHQAAGVASTTTATGWEPWAMALVIDAGLVAAKLTPYICKSEEQRRAIEVYAKPLAIGLLILTAYFNAAGFYGFVPMGVVRGGLDIFLGAAVPGIIFCLSQMTAILTIGRTK